MAMKIGHEEFIEKYLEAHKAGLRGDEFAESVGLSQSAVSARRVKLNKMGVGLPHFDSVKIKPFSPERLKAIQKKVNAYKKELNTKKRD